MCLDFALQGESPFEGFRCGSLYCIVRTLPCQQNVWAQIWPICDSLRRSSARRWATCGPTHFDGWVVPVNDGAWEEGVFELINPC